MELVQKAAVIGVPDLVAVSAPTALAIRAAEVSGITFVAVARPGTASRSLPIRNESSFNKQPMSSRPMSSPEVTALTMLRTAPATSWSTWSIRSAPFSNRRI